MSRRRGELTIRQVKADWPICIVVPQDLWGPIVPWMDRHTAHRGGSAFDENSEQLSILYLRDQAIADRILKFCDGWPFDGRLYVEGTHKHIMRRPWPQTLHVGPAISKSQRRPFWPPPIDERSRG